MSVHKTAAQFGIHVLPKHYYSPFADIEDLRRTSTSWAQPSAMVGVNIPTVVQQLEAVRALLMTTNSEEWRSTYDLAVSEAFGQGFGRIEARVLDAFLRSTKPRRVIEIGGGVTSACIAGALKANGGQASHTVIEPYPSPALTNFDAISLMRKPVQVVELDFFHQLGPGDLLFVDSSHVVNAGSDVCRIILEILPRLAPGVYVHFHDINFPYDFRADILESPFSQGAEGALLHAFLTGNSGVEVLFALSQIHHECPHKLQELIPEYHPVPTRNGLCENEGRKGKEVQHGTAGLHLPASIYLRTRPALRP